MIDWNFCSRLLLFAYFIQFPKKGSAAFELSEILISLRCPIFFGMMAKENTYHFANLGLVYSKNEFGASGIGIAGL